MLSSPASTCVRFLAFWSRNLGAAPWDPRPGQGGAAPSTRSSATAAREELRNQAVQMSIDSLQTAIELLYLLRHSRP